MTVCSYLASQLGGGTIMNVVRYLIGIVVVPENFLWIIALLMYWHGTGCIVDMFIPIDRS